MPHIGAACESVKLLRHNWSHEGNFTVLQILNTAPPSTWWIEVGKVCLWPSAVPPWRSVCSLAVLTLPILATRYVESSAFRCLLNLNVIGFPLIPQVCSSCCEGNICNVLVPRNDSSAIFSSISPLVSLSGSLHSRALCYIIIAIIVVIFTAGRVWDII